MRAIADLIYPEPCAGCGVFTRGGICLDCLYRRGRIGPPNCARCGAPTDTPVEGCLECSGRGLGFDRARQAVPFGNEIRRAIHSLKYAGHSCVAEALALPLAELAAGLDGRWAITWVPSGGKRLRQRGFDQARLLAEALAKLAGKPCAQILVRVREAPPQVGLEPSSRRRNLDGAFATRIPPPPRVLVIDDVYTTGASASEAARALKSSGARDVTALAVARTIGRGRSFVAGLRDL